MNQGRIIVITGAPGTGKTTTASVVAKESDLEKSVHMHTDDFYHYHKKYTGKTGWFQNRLRRYYVIRQL